MPYTFRATTHRLAPSASTPIVGVSGMSRSINSATVTANGSTEATMSYSRLPGMVIVGVPVMGSSWVCGVVSWWGTGPVRAGRSVFVRAIRQRLRVRAAGWRWRSLRLLLSDGGVGDRRPLGLRQQDVRGVRRGAGARGVGGDGTHRQGALAQDLLVPLLGVPTGGGDGQVQGVADRLDQRPQRRVLRREFGHRGLGHRGLLGVD